MENQKRIDWIDYAKALGIILVYVGHTGIPDELKSRIYMFHMPLFFLISGFLWNQDQYMKMPIGEFVKKKFKSYIIPYFKIGLVCLIIWGVFVNAMTLPLIEFKQALIRYVFGLCIYSRGTIEFMPHCSPIWFLTCLFCAEILFCFVMKSSRPQIFITICIVLAIALQYSPKLYWNIDTAVTSAPFLYAGYLIRQKLCLLTDKKILTPMIVVSLYFLIRCDWWTDFDGNRYDNVILMYLSSLSISVMLLASCYATDNFVRRYEPSKSKAILRPVGGVF